MKTIKLKDLKSMLPSQVHAHLVDLACHFLMNAKFNIYNERTWRRDDFYSFLSREGALQGLEPSYFNRIYEAAFDEAKQKIDSVGIVLTE